MKTQHLDLEHFRLAYIRQGPVAGQPLLFLHGHYGRGRNFASTIERFAREGWDCIALDQRGHGKSERAESYGRVDYVDDLVGAIRLLDLAPAIVIGHSLGGVNAYQLGAWHPELVKAIAVIDIGALCRYEFSLRGASGEFPSLAMLRKEMGRSGGLVDDGYFLEGVEEVGSGWRLLSDPEDMAASQAGLNGDHWQDWTSGSQPALLMRGERSEVLSAEHAAEMTARRKGVSLVEVPRAGHLMPMTHEKAFCDGLEAFLDALR